jgi:hypothetical protein
LPVPLKHCKGDEYEGGKCNFKREFTTQSYWDEKKEQAEQRRQEREEQQAEQAEELPVVDEITEDEPELIEETPVEDTGDDNVVEVDFGGEADEPSAVGEGAGEELAVAASHDQDAPLEDRTADLRKEAPGDQHLPAASPKRNRQYEHIKDSCLESGKSEEECKELAARTVNKQRAEHGETKDSKTADFPFSHPNQDYLENPPLRPRTLMEELHPEDPYDDADSYHDGPCINCSAPIPPGDEVCPNCGVPTRDDYGEYEPGDLRGQDMYSKTTIAEALETVDVTKDTHPDWDRSRKRPTEPPDTEMEGSPHPTVTVDPTEPIVYENDATPFEGTNAVSEKQDVTKAEDAQKGKGGTFPKGTGANPVTSAADVNTNPVREILLEQDEDGFLGEDEVLAAVAKRR